MEIIKTEDVFVPVGMPELTFITREHLERSVQAWKMNKAKHLLIFGPSKSGKTSLWKKYISEKAVIKIPCNNNKTLENIYDEILNDLNVYYTSEKTQGREIETGFLSELKSLLPFMSAKVGAQLKASDNDSKKEELISKPKIGANLVVRFLKPSKKIVLLEDFHYGNDQFKIDLSQDLKAFSDENCPWVLVGIQHKTSELLSYNMDLQQRIGELPVEGFTKSELVQIIRLGELALNIKFNKKVESRILEESFDSASLVQNICLRICLILKILETTKETKEISDEAIVEKACREIAFENRNYYEKVIKHVSYGGRSDGSTEKYKWFLKLIKEIPIPEQGLKNTDMYKYMKDLGHSGIDQGSVTSGLGFLPKLLQKNNFPSFFDYDPETKTFYLLDKYMKFVFKWLPELVDDLFKQDA